MRESTSRLRESCTSRRESASRRASCNTTVTLDEPVEQDLGKSVASILKDLSDIKASQERMEEYFAKIAQPESFAWSLDALNLGSCAEVVEGRDWDVPFKEAMDWDAPVKAVEQEKVETTDQDSSGDDAGAGNRRTSEMSMASKKTDIDINHPLRSLTVAFADDRGAKYLKCGTRNQSTKKSRGTSIRTSVRRLTMLQSGNIFERIVFHPTFEVVSAAILLIHCLIIAAYVESVAISLSSGDAKSHLVLKIGNQIFVIIFILEVVVKIGAERHEYFCGKERAWNAFDLLLVTLVFAEVFISVVSSTMDEHREFVKKLLKIGETIRTVRVLRILRVLRFSSALRLILVKIFNSTATLFWVMVLIFMLLFVIAVCITHGASSYLDDADVGDFSSDELQVAHFYGSVPRSFLTLFKAVTGGSLWGDMADALMDISLFYAMLFVMYIGFTVFAVLNLITGIFVDAALQTALHERDLIMERQAEMEEASVEHLREVFFDMDEEEDGLILIDQFREYLKDERVKSYMHALKIDTSDAAQLFRLLDSDNSGEILIDEFVEGCMKLRGEAKSMDIHIMMCENRRMWIKLNLFVHNVTDRIEELHRAVKHALHVSGRLSSMSASMLGCTSQQGYHQRSPRHSATSLATPLPPMQNSRRNSNNKHRKQNGSEHEDAWTTLGSMESGGHLSLRPPNVLKITQPVNDVSPPTTHPFGLHVENVDADALVSPVPVPQSNGPAPSPPTVSHPRKNST